MRTLLACIALGGCVGGAGQTTVDGRAGDAPASEACPARPTFVTTHPNAAMQPTDLGRVLGDTEGWHGRLYFGYGDMETNSGPIVMSSYDPVTGAWEDHLSFDTEHVARFRRIGDELWAPAIDPRGAPDYAAGTSAHAWRQVDIGDEAAHVFDVVERAPGDVLLVGADWAEGEPSASGGAVWRSTDGGLTWPRVFPDHPDQDVRYVPWFWDVGTIDGRVYTGLASAWGGLFHDGTAWSWEGPNLAEFAKPVEFAGAMVFGAIGTLVAFDGTQARTLGTSLFDLTTPGSVANPAGSVFVRGPYEVADGRLIVVTADRRVVMTTDLETWSCLGEAPADFASIGALDGVVYFGAADARIYALDRPSW